MDMTDTVRSGSPWPSLPTKRRKAHAYHLIDQLLSGEARRSARWWLHHRCATGENLERFIDRMQAGIDQKQRDEESAHGETGAETAVDFHATV